MLQLRYNDQHKVTGIRDSIRPGDSIVVQIHSEDEGIDNAIPHELLLSLDEPQTITNGNFTFGYSTSSATLRASECTAFALHTAFNRMDAIVSAGGVQVTGENGIFTIAFDSVGSRSTPTLSHSSLGTLSGRYRTVVAGGVSAKAIFELDLTVQTLVRNASGSNLTGATITVANVATGNSTTAQRDTITLSQLPDRGKFQIWTSADVATRWIRPDASAYEVQAALDDVEPDSFIVDRQIIGDDIVFDLRRTSVGTNSAPTVVNTFSGPDGLSFTFDMSLVQSLLAVIGGRPKQARLSFRYFGETQFSELVELSPLFWSQSQVI